MLNISKIVFCVKTKTIFALQSVSELIICSLTAGQIVFINMSKYVMSCVKNFSYTGAKTDSEFYPLETMQEAAIEVVNKKISKMSKTELRDMTAELHASISNLQAILRQVTYYQDKVNGINPGGSSAASSFSVNR